MRDFLPKEIKIHNAFGAVCSWDVVDAKELNEFFKNHVILPGPFRIEDKEPKVDQTVLAFNGRTWEQCYYDQDAFLLDDGNHEPVFEDVTHWMPMPDPIKE